MTADKDTFAALFSREKLENLFPADRADQFFDALFGDAEEGSYDIKLRYEGSEQGRLVFNLELHQRPGKCLACNLTYGLPNVFARHPVIDVQGIVDEINQLLNGQGTCTSWQLGNTREISRQLHVVPLIIDIQ